MDFEGKEGLLFRNQATNWSNISLPWMAFGYGVSVTPMQTLAFYNAEICGTGKTTICVRNKRVEKTIVKMKKRSH
jgi:cell division protein FtsI (penicillin-binding protein 3)